MESDTAHKSGDVIGQLTPTTTIEVNDRRLITIEMDVRAVEIAVAEAERQVV
jgi:hypothetical protein